MDGTFDERILIDCSHSFVFVFLSFFFFLSWFYGRVYLLDLTTRTAFLLFLI